MNIALVQPPAVHPTEPPRPAQHPTPESSRPVLAPTATEPSAQQVRSDDRHGRREAGPNTGTHPHPEPTRGKGGQDPLIGAILDVFA